MAIISNLVARLSVDHAAFDRGMQSGRQSLHGLAQQSVLSNKALAGMAATALKTAAVAGGLYAIKQALTASYREAANFETGLAKIGTQLDKSSMGMLPQYAEEIRRMSIAYGEATASLAQGGMDILGSGIAPAKAMGVLEAATIAAKGGFTTTATVVKAVVGVLNAYGMEADRASHITDIMHKVVQNGVISFEELAHGFGMVTSLSAVLGVDLEAVGAAIATITRAGVPAEIAITSLRAILNAFMNPTDDARKAAAELGFQLDATSIQGAGLVTVIEKLRGANAAQLEALMPNVRGLVGLTAMFQNAEGVQTDLIDMQNATGASMEKLAKVQETATFAADRAAAAWARLKEAMGDVFLPDITDKMNSFADAVQGGNSRLEYLVSLARQASHPLDTLTMFGRQTGSPLLGGVGGKEAVKSWTETRSIFESLDTDMQDSFKEAFNNRQILLDPNIKWEPKKKPDFDPAKMPVPWDYGSSLKSIGPSRAAEADIEYAQKLAAAYARASDVQAKVRAGIEAQMAVQEKARAAAETVAEVAPRIKEPTKEERELQEKVGVKVRDIEFEASLLKMTNAQREQAILLRQMENEAAKEHLELTVAQREELIAALELYEQQQKIAELGQIAGVGLVDSMRAVTNAIIENGNAWEALRGVALNVLANIQEALVWKPLENMATGFFTSFLGNLVGGGMGGGSAAQNAAGNWQIGTEMEMGRGYGLALGGTAGSGGVSRMMPMGLFAGAPRFRLGADEVPSILHVGERVTPAAGVAAERQAFSQMVGLLRLIAMKDTNVHLHDYRPSAEQYMRSRSGQRDVMYAVQRNSPD